MINPFILDYKTRLQSWKDLRSQVVALDNIEAKLLQTCKFWQQAPIENKVIDWDDSSSWPDAWMMISRNHYCDSTLSLAVAYTLLLVDPSESSNIRLCLITDRQNEIQKIVLKTHEYVVNHGWLDIIPKKSLVLEVNRRWLFDGKHWVEC